MNLNKFFGVSDSRDIGATDKFKEIFQIDDAPRLGYLLDSSNGNIELVTKKSGLTYNIDRDVMIRERMFFPLAMNEDVAKKYTKSALGKADKAVIKSFADKKELDGTKLSTDGKTLDMQGIGGKAVAKWNNGNIEFRDASGRADQALIKTLKKLIDPQMINEATDSFVPSRVLIMQQYVADTDGNVHWDVFDAILKITSGITWDSDVERIVDKYRAILPATDYSYLSNAFNSQNINIDALGEDESAGFSFVEEDEYDYSELKNAAWPSGIHPSFDDLNLTVSFASSDDKKQIAEFVDSLIDFGGTSAHEILGITEEMTLPVDEETTDNWREELPEDFGSSDWFAVIKQIKDEYAMLNDLDAAIKYAAEDWYEDLGFDTPEEAYNRIESKYWAMEDINESEGPNGIDEVIYNALNFEYVADAIDHVFSEVPRDKEQWFDTQRDQLRKFYISKGLKESEEGQTETAYAGFDTTEMEQDKFKEMLTKFNLTKVDNARWFKWDDPKGNMLVTYYDPFADRAGLLGYVGIEGTDSFVDGVVAFIKANGFYKDFQAGERNFI